MADENHNSENNPPEKNKESAKDKWREIAERLAEIKKSKEVSEISNEPVDETELEKKRREIAERLAAIKNTTSQTPDLSETTLDSSKKEEEKTTEKTIDKTTDKKVEDGKVIGSDVITPLTDIEEIESNVPTFTESVDRDIDNETEIHTIIEDPELGDDFNDAELYTQPEETKMQPATPETLEIDVLEKEPDVPVFDENIDRGIDESLEIQAPEDDTEVEKTKDVKVPNFDEPEVEDKENNQQEISTTPQVTEEKKTDTIYEPTTTPPIDSAEVEAEEEKIKKMFMNEEQNIKNNEAMKADTKTSDSEKKESSEKSEKSSRTQKKDKAQPQKKRPRPQRKKRVKTTSKQKEKKKEKPEKTVTFYLINDQVIKALQQKGLPNKTIINLRRIKNKKYKPKDVFLKVLHTTIGSNAVEEYGKIIVEEAEKTEKKKSGTAIIVLLIFFAIIVGISIYFYFNRSQWNQIITEFGMKETIENITKSEVSDTDKTSEPPITDETNKNTENETKPPATKTPEISEAAIKKWGLKPPFTIISYGSFTKEQTAKQQTAKLKGLGYKAGYYWIPDYSPNSKPLFKVYVGPYKNENQANKALPIIQKLMNDAYIINY